MTAKIMGAFLILAACGGMGFSVAAAHRRKERLLQQLIRAIRYMICELQYRQTPLPQLIQMSASETSGVMHQVLSNFAGELELQLTPDAACCMNAVVGQDSKLPEMLREKLLLLGRSLGRFDLAGQIAGLEAVCQLCKRDLDGLLVNRDARLRSYMTLGVCAGVALVILFV